MALLATQADLEKFGMVDITAEPDAAITFYLEMASAMIESYCNRVFTEEAGIVEIHDGGSYTIFLNRPPVTAVSSVVEDGETLLATDYWFFLDGRLVRRSSDSPKLWARKFQTVIVTYTGGFNSIPNDIRGACCQIADRIFKTQAAWASTAAAGGVVKSVALAGSDTVTYADPGTSSGQEAAVQLTEVDKQVLNPYRLVGVA